MLIIIYSIVLQNIKIYFNVAIDFVYSFRSINVLFLYITR